MKIRFVIAAGMVLGSAVSAGAIEADPTVSMQVIGTRNNTSFPKLFFLHVDNASYAPLNLGQAITTSALIIDGQPSKRKPMRFDGPPGIAPMGSWEGCISAEDYLPAITPGKHKVSLQFGKKVTPPINVRWEEPENWKKGNLKSRMKEIKALGEVLTDGLPQECVELWLTVKDGGLQSDDKVRYFLEPHIKITLPYRKVYEGGVYNTVVDGSPLIYQENAAND